MIKGFTWLTGGRGLWDYFSGTPARVCVSELSHVGVLSRI